MLAGNFKFADLLQAIITLGIELPAAWQHQFAKIDGFTVDSRQVNATTAFIALQGVSAHGSIYIPGAIENGGKLILEDIQQGSTSQAKLIPVSDDTSERGCVVIQIANLASKLVEFFKTLYPQITKLKQVLAITGTNGKTSVASLYAQMLSHTGRSAATIGTLGCMQYHCDGTTTNVAKTYNTTPDNVSLFGYLAWFADQDVYYVALEASSHGIEQGRTFGLPIDVAVFTNLTQDHLDYHGSMSAYGAAKRKLLNNPRIKSIVINADDPESERWRNAVNSGQQILSFSVDDRNQTQAQGADALYADCIEYLKSGIQFRLNTLSEKHHMTLSLIGQFNVANYLAALGALTMAGIELATLIKYADKLVGVKGRMELIKTHSASIIVDFAHTPDALKQALVAARKHTANQLWIVFGCGGDRDKAKRPEMGKIAASHADKIVLTQDNSRFEHTDKIIDEICQGISNEGNVDSKSVIRIVERQSAIKFALSNAENNDLILVAGKGHEDYLDIQGQKIHYDERAYVKTLAGEFL